MSCALPRVSWVAAGAKYSPADLALPPCLLPVPHHGRVSSAVPHGPNEHLPSAAARARLVLYLDGRARRGGLCWYPHSAAGRYLNSVLHHCGAVQPGLGEICEAAVAPNQSVNLR